MLLDLKHLLLEAKQKIPPVLAVLQAENEGYLDLGGMTSRYCVQFHFLFAKDDLILNMFSYRGTWLCLLRWPWP